MSATSLSLRPEPIQSLPPRVFISYSHADRHFVERLAIDLAHRGIVVWWDEWEIRVGDSLVSKIEEGITSSSYLAIVLSPDSVSSAWVREELNAGLVRQLSEHRVLVLPLLLEDCGIPTFLLEKKYADFRSDYESGLDELTEAIKPPSTDSHGGAEEGEYHHDYAFDWGTCGSLHAVRASISSHSPQFPYTVSCSIFVVANEKLSSRFDEFVAAGYPWAARAMLLSLADELTREIDTVILIEGDQETTQQYTLSDPALGVGVSLDIAASRLGSDPGSDLYYEWASVFKYIARRHREGIRRALAPDEADHLGEWCRLNPIRCSGERLSA